MIEQLLGWFTVGWQAIVMGCMVCLGAACGLLSPYVVANRMAFFSDAVAHSTLAGVALGMMVGVDPVTAMLVCGVVVSLGIAGIKQFTRGGIDSLLGVVMAGMLALGVILYHYNQGFQDLHSVLFGGRVTFLTLQELAVLGGTLALVLGLVFVFGNRWALLAVSRPLAQARGTPVRMLETVLLVLLGFVVGVGVSAVGLLLINAMLIVPAATAKNLVRTWRGLFVASVVCSVLSCVVGLVIGKWADLPPAPAIVVVGVALFLVSVVFAGVKSR